MFIASFKFVAITASSILNGICAKLCLFSDPTRSVKKYKTGIEGTIVVCLYSGPMA